MKDLNFTPLFIIANSNVQQHLKAPLEIAEILSPLKVPLRKLTNFDEKLQNPRGKKRGPSYKSDAFALNRPTSLLAY